MKRTLPAIAAIFVLALAGCGNDNPTNASPATPSSTPAATTANPNQVECVNIDRAYNAWSGSWSLPKAAADLTGINEVAMNAMQEEGKGFLDAVTGYHDQPSKGLAVAVSEYNVEVSMANVQFTIGDGVEADQADKVMTMIGKVHTSYQEFKTATCR